jgi:hypothetical protein
LQVIADISRMLRLEIEVCLDQSCGNGELILSALDKSFRLISTSVPTTR